MKFTPATCGTYSPVSAGPAYNFSMSQQTLWTIGHSNRPLEEFLALLDPAGVPRPVNAPAVALDATAG